MTIEEAIKVLLTERVEISGNAKQNIAVCTECSFERNLDDNFGRAVSCPNCGCKMDLEG